MSRSMDELFKKFAVDERFFDLPEDSLAHVVVEIMKEKRDLFLDKGTDGFDFALKHPALQLHMLKKHNGWLRKAFGSRHEELLSSLRPEPSPVS
jgi:hypothetical protein